MIISGLTLAAVGVVLWAMARLIYTLEGFTMSTQAALDAITATLVKAQREIVARIADVQAQLDAAGVAEQIDLSSLTAAAQALDDVVPDVAPDVEPEPVV